MNDRCAACDCGGHQHEKQSEDTEADEDLAVSAKGLFDHRCSFRNKVLAGFVRLLHSPFLFLGRGIHTAIPLFLKELADRRFLLSLLLGCIGFFD